MNSEKIRLLKTKQKEKNTNPSLRDSPAKIIRDFETQKSPENEPSPQN